MNIRNYTSSVPADQSVINIERKLVDRGAMNEELSTAEVEAILLKKLKWEKLKEHSAAFVVRQVVKILGEKVKFFGQDEVEYTIKPVTTWPKDSPVKHDNFYVYEVFRGYKAVILREREVGGVVQCQVRLRKGEGNESFVTWILKKDLSDGKEKE